MINPVRRPLTFSAFTLKEFETNKEGNRIDGIPDGSDHSIDAVRNATMDEALRGWAVAFLVVLLAIVLALGIAALLVLFQTMRVLACALVTLALLALVGQQQAKRIVPGGLPIGRRTVWGFR